MLRIAMISLAMAALPAAAQINVFGNGAVSTENTGSTFAATLDYNASLAKLSISITNTTPGSVGGALTGLAFRFDSSDPGAVVTMSMTTAHADFATIGSTGVGGTGIFADTTYHAGAALDGNFLGGGNPNRGIASGDTETFVFDVTATDSASLTHSSFFPDAEAFIARFRGLDNGGSDRVATPAPSAALALGAFGLGMAGRRRR